jgi:catechol 2,3-dioxygenase
MTARLGHVALKAQDPLALSQFYREMFDMQLVGGTATNSNAFVGNRPQEENHDLAFFRTALAAHIGFKVDTLRELLDYYRKVKASGRKIDYTFNHGFALAMYFSDPEGNGIEIYWPTGRQDYQPPYVEPLNLDLSEEELLHIVEQMPGQNTTRE